MLAFIEHFTFVCAFIEKGEVSRLEKINQYLHEELSQAKSTNQNLTKTLEDNQNENSVHKKH